MTGAGDLGFACASMLVDELVRGGVMHVVVSPGARSTPLVLAAARRDGVACHVILDERSAGFFALGIAKSTRRPVVLICTSGTAAANYYPAVIEARYSQTPLIVLTADRPPEVRDTGANQTIDQTRLYGTAPLWFAETPLPEASGGAAAEWRSIGARAAAIAAGPPRGPVHLNVPFAEPLIPSEFEGSTRSLVIPSEVDVAGSLLIPSEPAAAARSLLGLDAAGRANGEPWEVVPARMPELTQDEIDAIAAELQRQPRGVVFVGGFPDHEPPLQIAELSARLGWPLIAEPQSGLRIPGSRALTAPQFVIPSMRPSMVLAFGDPPTTRASRALLECAERVITVEPFRWTSLNTRIVRADPIALAAAATSLVHADENRAWLERWIDVDARVRTAVDEILNESETPFEGRIARDLAAALQPGSHLAIGSSLPVRDLDQFMRPGAVRVTGNRGASGIDGFISTIFGIAEAEGRAVGLMGDLTFLHDAGSLAWLTPRTTATVTLVVTDNAGGGIFDLLPQSSLPEHERFFVTPHSANLGAIAMAAGCDSVIVEKASDLESALAHTGVRVIQVLCDRTRSLSIRSRIAEVTRGLTSTSSE